MRILLLTGASLLALAPAAAFAQPADQTGDATAIDTPIDDAPAPAAAPAPTGDPLTDRLNALEARVDQLQSENKALRDEIDADQARLQSVEQRSAKAVQFGWGPTLSDTGGKFTFKPRGTLEIDYAGFVSRKGGYDFSNGTQIRRGRFGFDGKAFGTFGYRMEAEFVGGNVTLLDAFVSYTGVKNWAFTIGNQKAPAGLEANSSDSVNEFLERGMANVAFGAVGGERRIGISAQYARAPFTVTLGVFGAGEAVGRSATTPDEAYSVNGRVTWEPINEDGRVVHLGASSYYATNFDGNTITLRDRPGTRVDGGYLVSATIAGSNPAGGRPTGARNAIFYGLEGAAVWGPVSIQGEYSHLTVNRFDAAPALNFDGYYIFGSVFLTGESRAFRQGLIDRVKPIRAFDPASGNWGAFELALRYDRLNLTERKLSPLDRDGHTITAALNWYLNGNVKVDFNYIRFTGHNSPLYALPLPVAGAGARTVAGDAFATRLHLDF